MKKYNGIVLIFLFVLLVSLGSSFVFASDNQTAEFSEVAADNDVEVDLASQGLDYDAVDLTSQIVRDDENLTLQGSDDENLTQTSGELLCDEYEPDANGIYVSPNGSNKGEGTYYSPYATIAKAISQAKDGKTIYLASGVYKIDSPFSISKNSLTFTSYDGGSPVLDGQNKSRIFKLLDNYAFTFNGITFMNGYAENGGVVDFFSLNKFSATFYNCTFVNNTATNNGGVFYVGRNEAMYSMWDFLYLTSCSFYNNSAKVGSIYFGGSNTFSRLDMHYCVAINNTNYAVYATSNRDGSVSENYWGTNGDVSGIVRYNSDYVAGSKLTLISDNEFPTTDDRIVFTAKIVRSDGNDYSSGILIPEIPITFATTSGNLSRTATTIVNNKGQVILTPSGAGDVDVTVYAFDTFVTKSLTILPAPQYVSADARPGEGNGSFNSPYCLRDAIEAVNDGGVNRIALFEGDYEFDETYLITRDVTICPYSTPYMMSNVNIISNNGFLNISEGINVNIYNLTIHNSNSEILPIFNLQSNSRLDIKNLVIKDNALNGNGKAIIAIVANGSLLNIGYSHIVGNNASLKTVGQYGYLFSNNGTIIADNNWWGSNRGSSFYDYLVLGRDINASKWFVLSQTQEKQLLRTEWSSKFTIQLTDNDNNVITEYLPSLNISFNTNTGVLDILEYVLSKENDYFVSNKIAGVTEEATVNSICNDEHVITEFAYEIPLTEIFISVDGDDENGTGSIGNPFLTISKAISRAKEAGSTIYFLDGSYDVSVVCNGLYHLNGGGGFNTINNRNLTFSSYDGKVIFDRSNSYYVFGFGSNTNVSIIDIHFANTLFSSGSKMGGIKSSGTLTIRNCSFDNVSEGGNFAEFIGMDGGKLYIYNSNFTNICTCGKQYTNSAIRISGSSTYVYVNNCYFKNNGYYRTTVDNVTVYRFSDSESCFRTQYGFMEIEDSIFENCSHIAMIYDNGRMNFKGCLFKDIGGASCLYVSSRGSGFDVDNCTFINNTAGAIGVGLQQYLKDNEINIRNSRFINNSASNGGAIELVRAGAVISNCYFEGNSAVNGGAIYNSYASLLLEHCEFYNNSASNCGGSIYTEGTDDFIDIQYNVFENSKAGIGGVIYTKGITSLFYNIMKNSTALKGSYIYNDNRVGNVYLNILNNTTVSVYRGMPITITAFLSDDMANPISGGEIVFKFSNEEISLTSTEGFASFNHTFDEVGSYVIDGNYTGSRRYVVVVGTSVIDVVKRSVELIIPSIEVYYSVTGNVSVILKDAEGNFLSENITLTIDGTDYHIHSDENGTAYQEFNLPLGSYPVFAKFDENEDYYSSNASGVVNVLSTIWADDLTRGYNSGMDFQATLLDVDGSPLNNANVRISVNNKEYNLTSDSNGVIKLNKKITVGSYFVTVFNPVSLENVTKKLSVVKRIVSNRNLVMFYMDGSKFKVRVVGDKGGYVGAGEKVTFKIAGVTYTVKTDKYGYASLAIKQLPKKYTVTAQYKGFKTTNTVNVKQILKAYNLKVKKTAKQLKVKVLLYKVNNKYLKGKLITLKFAGKTYKTRTNYKGVALFTINKNLIGKLKVGKQYTYTATYLKTTLKKQITVVK